MDGSMNGKKHSKEDIETMRGKGIFKRNYSVYMQKIYFPAEVARQKILEWWCNYKVVATFGRPQARGQLDPRTLKSLFTEDSKSAIEEAIKKVEYVIPKISTDEVYITSQAPPRSKNDLPHFKSVGTESTLESYHAV
jgi:hypothetical protein